MKKQLLTALSIVTLGNVVGGVIVPSTHAVTTVQATAIADMSIDELREFVLNGSPMTQAHWDQIPDEALLRYAQNAGPTMVSDQIFNAAFADYPSVFASDVERVKNVLINTYGVTEADILAVGERYLLWDEWFKHGDLSVVASQIKTSEDTSSEGVEETPEESTQDELPRQHTREEAEELANGEWGATFRSHIMSRITEAQLARLPENAIFEAAVAYKMEFPIGVNPNVSFDYLKAMYPEAFVEDPEETESQENGETEAEVVLPDTEGQRNIDEHVEQATESAEETELESLERNQSFIIDSIEYTVKNVYLVEKETREEQEEADYVLDIRYEYNDDVEENINLHEQKWQANTRVTQAVEGEVKPLRYGDIRTEEEMAELDETEVRDNSGVVYYEVTDLSKEATLSVSTDSGVEQFAINLEELLQLPPQSGLFLNTESRKAGYLFDFETLYVLYNSVEEALEWDGIEEADVNVEVESKEALTQLEQLDNAQELAYVALNDVFYTLNDEGVVEARVDSEDSEEGTVLFELTTEDDYASIVVEEATYDLVARP